MIQPLKHKRVLLKITGEALKGRSGPFDKEAIDFIAQEIKSAQTTDTELIIVLGGGNIVRGNQLTRDVGIAKAPADMMGMMATVMNGIALQNVLEKMLVQTRVMSSIEIKAVTETFFYRKALSHLEQGRVVILAGGTGVPGLSTDTCAVLRALELDAQAVYKGTKVDGVYDKDPVRYPTSAKLIPKLTHQQFLDAKLEQILDVTAVSRAQQDKLPIVVFRIFQKSNLLRVLRGENVGSLIS